MKRKEYNKETDIRLKRLRSDEKIGYEVDDITEVGKHTGGHLDIDFGQRSAFPDLNQYNEKENDNSASVYAYLRSVRREAEGDRCIYYAHKSIQQEIESNFDEERANNTQENIEKEIASKTNEKTIDLNEKGNELKTELQKKKWINWRNEVLQDFLSLKEQIRKDVHSMNTSELSEISMPQTATQWRSFIFESEPPSIECLINVLDHTTIIKLIVYFTKWLCFSTNENVSKWIWMVLLRLDAPLEINECSIIRDFGKKALKLSQKFKNNNIPITTKYTINMILIIIGDYYGQRDLLEPLY